MEYMIESDQTPQTLVFRVDMRIKEGWEPVGGLVYIKEGDDGKCYQALTKRDESNQWVMTKDDGGVQTWEKIE